MKAIANQRGWTRNYQHTKSETLRISDRSARRSDEHACSCGWITGRDVCANCDGVRVGMERP